MTVTQGHGTQGSDHDTSSTAGRARRERAQGDKAQALQAVLTGYDAGMAEYVDDFIFGKVWGRPGLSFEERMIVAITALAATEHPHQLRNYLHGALQDGIPASKIQEVVVMLGVYCGFPTALQAMTEWQSVLASVRRHGMALDLDES